MDLIFEERLFYGTVIGAMAVSLAGFVTASLFGFSATSVWSGATIALAASAAGWFRGRGDVLPNLRVVHAGPRLKLVRIVELDRWAQRLEALPPRAHS